MHRPLRQLRRLLVFVVGGTVVLVGVIMIVSPGPAVIVIPAGLAILGVEFAWARRLLARGRTMVQKAGDHMGRRGGKGAAPKGDGADDTSDKP